MSTKSKVKAPASKPKKDTKQQQPQSLLKKAVNTVKSTIMGGKISKTQTSGIYVKGISHKQSLDDIKVVFQAAGEIKDCRRRSDKFALIWFVDQQSVKKAIDMFHHKNIDAFPVQSTKVAGAEASNNERYRTYHPSLYASGKRNVSTLNKYIVQPAKVSPAPERAMYCKTVFVSGLPNTEVLPNATLRAAFAKHGKVVKMTRYNATAFTFVYYAEVATAVKAQGAIHGHGLGELLKDVKEEPRPTKKGEKKKEAKPIVLPKPDHPLHAALSVRTKERDDAREGTARKHSKHNDEHKKWVRGTGF